MLGGGGHTVGPVLRRNSNSPTQDDPYSALTSWIEQSEASARDHEAAVRQLLSRHEAAARVGQRWRVNVLKRQLQRKISSGAAGPARGANLVGKLIQRQVFKHFDGDVVDVTRDAVRVERHLAREKNKPLPMPTFQFKSDAERRRSMVAVRKEAREKKKARQQLHAGSDAAPRSPLASSSASADNGRGGGVKGAAGTTPVHAAGGRRLRRRRRRRRKQGGGDRTSSWTGGVGTVAAGSMGEDHHHFHPLIEISGDRINVVEGGATDFYSVRLRKRPRAVVHVAIQDPHLQVTLEPRVLRFNERDWRTPQLVCVSAVDDTDKSSDSIESTLLEHVTASGDKEFDRIRFEVPVSISDNDGHYLWGFGSNVHRQLGQDGVGPAASLPAPVLGRTAGQDSRARQAAISRQKETRQRLQGGSGGKRGGGRKRKPSVMDVLQAGADADAAKAGIAGGVGTLGGAPDDEDDEDDGDGSSSGPGRSPSSAGRRRRAANTNRLGSGDSEVPASLHAGSADSARVTKQGRAGLRASFVANAKQSKPSMLFASIAAGRYTTLCTQTNGNTTQYGRNDGRSWYDCREMVGQQQHKQQHPSQRQEGDEEGGKRQQETRNMRGGGGGGGGGEGAGSPARAAASLMVVNPLDLYSRRIGTRKTYIMSVAAGSRHCIALTADAVLLAWGSNDCGQLGIGFRGRGDTGRDEDDKEAAMLREMGLGGPQFDDSGVDGGHAGLKSAHVDTVTGKVEFVNQPTPVRSGPLRSLKVTLIACGDSHTAVLVGGESRLFVWGRGRTGALGLESKAPPKPSPSSDGPSDRRRRGGSGQAHGRDGPKRMPIWVPGLSDRVAPDVESGAKQRRFREQMAAARQASKAPDTPAVAAAKESRRRARLKREKEASATLEARRKKMMAALSAPSGISGGNGWLGDAGEQAAAEGAKTTNKTQKKKKKQPQKTKRPPMGTFQGDLALADHYVPVEVRLPPTHEWASNAYERKGRKGGGQGNRIFSIACGYAHTAILLGAGVLLTCGWGGNGRLGRPIPVPSQVAKHQGAGGRGIGGGGGGSNWNKERPSTREGRQKRSGISSPPAARMVSRPQSYRGGDPGKGAHQKHLFYDGADPYFRRVYLPASALATSALGGAAGGGDDGDSSPAGDLSHHHHHAGHHQAKKVFALAVAVALGRAHSLCLTSGRRLWVWGDNRHGQLGLGTRTSVPLPRLCRILLPFARGNPTRTVRRAHTGGSGNSTTPPQRPASAGRPGSAGTEGSEEQASSAAAAGGSSARHSVRAHTKGGGRYKAPARRDLLAAIACGDDHSCAITEDGLLYMWGSNECGQLGLGPACASADEVLPRLHHPTLSLDVRQLAVGANHTLVITAECPERVYHAKSTFEETVLRQKRLVERDQRRRKRFQRRAKADERKRKVVRWRKRSAVMKLPGGTAKSHARNMQIQGAIYRTAFKKEAMENKRRQAARQAAAADAARGARAAARKRPASAAAGARLGAAQSGGRGAGASLTRRPLSAASGAIGSRSGGTPVTTDLIREWEYNMSVARPTLDMLGPCASPYADANSVVLNSMSIGAGIGAGSAIAGAGGVRGGADAHTPGPKVPRRPHSANAGTRRRVGGGLRARRAVRPAGVSGGAEAPPGAGNGSEDGPVEKAHGSSAVARQVEPVGEATGQQEVEPRQALEASAEEPQQTNIKSSKDSGEVRAPSKPTITAVAVSPEPKVSQREVFL